MYHLTYFWPKKQYFGAPKGPLNHERPIIGSKRVSIIVEDLEVINKHQIGSL